MKVCRFEKCKNYVWSDGYCKCHIKKSLLPKIGKNKESKNDSEEFDKMINFFMSIWNKREHISEISGEKLYEPVSTAYFHHILPKRKWEEAKFDEENIILITVDEHSSVEGDIYKYDKINELREYLLEKYNKNQ